MNNRKETFKNINIKGGNRTKKNNGLTSKVESQEQIGGIGRNTTQQAKTFINLISQGKELLFDNTFKNIYAEILTNINKIKKIVLSETTIVFDNDNDNDKFPSLYKFIKNTNLKLDKGKNVNNVKFNTVNQLLFVVVDEKYQFKSDIKSIYNNEELEFYSSINNNNNADNNNNSNEELKELYRKLTEYILNRETLKHSMNKHNPSFNLLVLAQLFLSIIIFNSDKYPKPEKEVDTKITIDVDKKNLLLECVKALLRAADEILTKGKNVPQAVEAQIQVPSAVVGLSSTPATALPPVPPRAKRQPIPLPNIATSSFNNPLYGMNPKGNENYGDYGNFKYVGEKPNVFPNDNNNSILYEPLTTSRLTNNDEEQEQPVYEEPVLRNKEKIYATVNINNPNAVSTITPSNNLNLSPKKKRNESKQSSDTNT